MQKICEDDVLVMILHVSSQSYHSPYCLSTTMITYSISAQLQFFLFIFHFMFVALWIVSCHDQRLLHVKCVRDHVACGQSCLITWPVYVGRQT